MVAVKQNTRINLHSFGAATVRRLYLLRKPHELVVDVRSDKGEIMHLSVAYVSKLLAAQQKVV